MNSVQTSSAASTKFIESQPKIWQDLYLAYTTIKDKEVLLKSVHDILVKYNFTDVQATTVAPQIISLIDQNFNPAVVVLPTPDSTPRDMDEDGAYLTKKDISILKKNLADEENIKVALYVVALAVYARNHPHRSNWIRYNKKEIAFLAGIHKLAVKDQEVISQIVHTKYGLNMQVVGSMQPIPCFQFSWQADPSNTPSEDNPLVIVSDYTPQSLFAFVMSSIYKANNNA